MSPAHWHSCATTKTFYMLQMGAQATFAGRQCGVAKKSNLLQETITVQDETASLQEKCLI